MKKSVILPLTDDKLIELRGILLDKDASSVLRFLKKHLEKPLSAALLGEGH